MPTTFLMLPPQSEKTREWARRLAETAPELDIIAPETMEGAEQAIATWPRAPMARSRRRSSRAPTNCAGCRRRRPRRPPGSITRS